jgi:hypothetical protein
MSRSTPQVVSRAAWLVIGVSVLSILAAILGHPAVAEIVGGGVIIYVSFLVGRPVTQRLAADTDPGRELIWNVLLVLVIVLALVGVGVMGAAVL